MRLLLDTQVLLWSVRESRRIPEATVRLLEDGANEVFYSAASIWEIAIKLALRRRDFQLDLDIFLRGVVEMNFTELPVTSSHAVEVTRLPAGHKDPFDRLLVAQARVEPLVLLTADRALLPYSENVRLITA